MVPRMFDPFLRATRTSTGLGLYIVEQIVKAYGGEVQAISSDAEGTTFSMRLPRSSAVLG
jgi:signal transduction histidine kinase